MKARRLPSGSWRVQVQINGKRYGFTRKTKRAAERAAADAILSRSDAPEGSLGALVDKYIADRENVLSPSTIERYKRIRKNHFNRLMMMPVYELTAERIQAEINDMSKDYSPKTVRNAYGLITATLDVYAPKLRFKVTMPARQKIEYHIPTAEDVTALIDNASPNMQTAIMLGAYCGLRRGEIVAAEASDIAGDALHVHRAAVYDENGKIVLKRPKTYHGDRYVFLPDIVREHLEGKTGRLCPLALSSVTRQFDDIRNRLGLKCRFHDLRHFYASFLHALGVPDQYIMEQGGWKSDQMLKSVYRNTLDDVKQKNAQKMNDFLNGKTSENPVVVVKSAHEVHTEGE